MKTYWSIPGYKDAPQTHCVAFYKYDGINLRVEWSKKRGWYKFGTRTRLLDSTDPDFGVAIPTFLEKYSESLIQVVRTSKTFRGVDRVIAFCEMHSPGSFAGVFVPGEKLDVTLIDFCVHKRGIMLPRQFLDEFGHLDVAKPVYEGNFNREFVHDVRTGKYPVAEGVVAKGVILGKKKNAQHGLWMAKVKTLWWLDELKRRAQEDPKFRQALRENLSEQG